MKIVLVFFKSGGFVWLVFGLLFGLVGIVGNRIFGWRVGRSIGLVSFVVEGVGGIYLLIWVIVLVLC